MPQLEETVLKKRRFIPPISLEHILLTELINSPSPVTPQPPPIPEAAVPQVTPASQQTSTSITSTTARTKENPKKRMAITELVNSPKKQRIIGEPLTPEGEQLPLLPLSLTAPGSPPLKPLHPPLPRKSGYWHLETLATLATTSSLPTRSQTPSEKKRKYVCGICNFGFHQAGGLRNHTNAVHLKQKPFGCTWPGCGRYGERGFAARGDLTRHESSVHRGERNFRCERCDMCFARRSVLVRHLKNIHKVAVAGGRNAGDGSVGVSRSGSS